MPKHFLHQGTNTLISIHFCIDGLLITCYYTELVYQTPKHVNFVKTVQKRLDMFTLTECEDVRNLWKQTEDWVRSIYHCLFKIADIEKIFGENNNSQIKEISTITVKEVIYLKIKKGPTKV